MQIKKIAVLGSGVMGGGIAAHCANAGISVLLLDMVPEGATDRNQLSKAAKARMCEATPSPFAHPECAARVTCGNLEDDLDALGEADWIIEAVLEKLVVKQAVYRTVDGVRKPGSIVSSNTSTLPLKRLVEGMPATFAADFCIAHFFNPVRFMPLLEMLASPSMDPARFEALCTFADCVLGKEVVPCKDTPGFIANRIGVYFMTLAMNESLAHGLDVAMMDAAFSRTYGIPKTGVFGLYDLIGLDLMPLIAQAMCDNIPPGDAFVALSPKPPVLEALIAEGYTGRKGKGGFYRLVREGNQKCMQVVDLRTGQYRPQMPVVEISAEAERTARTVIEKTVAYARTLLPDIAYSEADVDRAMQAGYSWKRGVFSLLGTTEPAPPARNYMTFSHVKSRAPITASPAARLWDAGEGVELFEITTKMNAFDEGVFDALEAALARIPRALMIAPDTELFSAGANLKQMLAWADAGDLARVRAFIARGQRVMMALKTAPMPVAAGLAGLALGGGCETLLHMRHVQAHLESSPGLVEVNVGLIPAWGGTKEMLLRHMDRAAAYQCILRAQIAGSALLARDMKILRPDDGITMNRARLLADTHAAALALSPVPAPIPMGKVTSSRIPAEALLETCGPLPPHQTVIARVLAQVMDFVEPLDETAVLARELDAFMELIAMQATRQRITHMLETGKPLIN